VSAERSIAAAGAALAYVEDDSVSIVKVRDQSLFRRAFGTVKRVGWRALLVTGLVIA
jgi:hypothetical protein